MKNKVRNNWEAVEKTFPRFRSYEDYLAYFNGDYSKGICSHELSPDGKTVRPNPEFHKAKYAVAFVTV